MAYTKEEMIEQVLLRVSGGKPTNELDIRHEDIGQYLPAAINYAMKKEYFINRQSGYSELPDDFIATYTKTLKQDTTRDLKYVDTPSILSLPKNRGIKTISPMQGDIQFIETTVSARLHDTYYAKHMAGIARYWIEGSKIYFLNQSLDAGDSVLIAGIASADDIKDTDQVPVPAGMEAEVIDLLTQFFTGQRTLPSDDISDDSDDIKKVRYWRGYYHWTGL